MSVLESIINFKEKEDAKLRADIGMVGNALQMFQQSRQNALLMEMEKKKLDVDLGTKGLRFNTEGQIVPATDLIESLSRGQEWKPRTKEEAFEFQKIGKQEGWKPQTRKEALSFEKAKQRPIGGIKEEILRKMSTGKSLTIEEQKIYDEIISKEKEFKITGADVNALKPGFVENIFGGKGKEIYQKAKAKLSEQITGNTKSGKTSSGVKFTIGE
jgi:hypothetical protein